MKISRRLALPLTLLVLAGPGGPVLPARAQDAGAPPTEAHDVVDRYFDVSVEDPYRWLESGDDPAVRRWSTAQNARTRRYLDGLPDRKDIYDRLWKQFSKTSPSFSSLRVAGGRIFARYSQPPKQQPMLAVLPLSADPAGSRVIVDPNALNPKGTTSIDWFVPSPDGRRVAVCLSDNGSEDGSIHVFDVATRRQVGEVIPRAQYPTAGGSLAWRADSKGFWYTRYPGPERPAAERHFFQKVYFHRLGEAPSKDPYVLGRDFPMLAEISLDSRQGGRLTLVTVANGDGGEYEHFVMGPDSRAQQVTRFEDKVVAAVIGPDDALYLVSRRDAPRGRLLKLEPGDLDLGHARTLVPESEPVMQGSRGVCADPVVITAVALYVCEVAGGPTRVAIYDREGRPQGELPLPDIATVGEVVPLGEGSLLYSVATYLKPQHFARFDEKSATAQDTRLVQVSPVSFGDAEVVREFATSKDGTLVPLNIVRRKAMAQDGSHPLLLTGYGGFGISLTPRFVGPEIRLWLDAGGVYVVANLRGGGEYGEQWHRQGSLTSKQNVFDDFAAAARYLVAQKYTSSRKLAIVGGSNGGLLMGAALTQHPDLFRAVVSHVGVYDMLRVELDPNGSFNTPEFGTVRRQDQFRALFAYSPYHQVTEETAYPAVLLLTGEHDGRVNPMQSRKMAARLQSVTGAGRPVLLRTEPAAGHGLGSSLSVRVAQAADVQAFLFDQLGMKLPKK
jgi:prolyl oligopeptidase